HPPPTPPLLPTRRSSDLSDTLADAPPLKAWQEVISEAFQRENVARVAPEWRSLTIPGVVEQEEPPQPRPALNVEPPAPAPPTEEIGRAPSELQSRENLVC